MMTDEKTCVTGSPTGPETRRRLKKEARQHLAGEMTHLLEAGESTLYWTGTKTDLMEAVHEVFVAGTVADACGCPETFTRLCDRFCRLFHVEKPHSPRTLVAHAATRKGLRQHPFADRYAYCLQQGDTHPLQHFWVRRPTLREPAPDPRNSRRRSPLSSRR